MTPASRAHQAIGQAVCAAQVLEVQLVVLFELFRMVSDPEYRELTSGRIDPNRLKTATKNLIKELSEKGNISPTLEVDINQWIEDRHTLVHRWYPTNGLGDENDEEHWNRYAALAQRVARESYRIAKLLITYVVKWGEPNWAAANPDEYLVRMKQLFFSDVESGGEPLKKDA